MKNQAKFTILILLFFLVFISQCFSATVIYDSDGAIDGIINLNINDSLYNVDFIEGSFSNVYSGQIPTYENNSSYEVLMAIRDTLNNENPVLFTFTDTSLFNIEIPRELLQNEWFSSYFIMPFIDAWAEPISSVNQNDHVGNWAIVTAVPIPNALVLLGFGLIFMLKFKKKITRRCSGPLGA